MSDLLALSGGHFGAIYADPPWSWASYSKTRQTRAASNHYGVMDLDAIKALPVASIADDDCACFMWSVNSMLPQALDVMAAWGFTFKTVAFTWAKRTPSDAGWHFGLGYWSRQNTESCLLGTRGKPKRLDRGVRELVVEPRREHSRKPDSVARSIERLVAGPYLELFARETRPGWSAGATKPRALTSHNSWRRCHEPPVDCPRRHGNVRGADRGPGGLRLAGTSEHDRLLDQLGIGPNSTPPAPRQLPRFQSERAPSGSLIATPPVAPEELNLTPLFAYQETALARVWEAIEAGETRIILQLPTGGGKTVLAAHIAAHKGLKGKVSAFLVPLKSLLGQTVKRFKQYGLRNVNSIEAGKRANPNAALQVCVIQTLAARRKNGRHELDNLCLVIVDEAHIRLDEVYRLMSEWPDVVFIGLSATPWAKNLGKHWEKLVVLARTSMA